MTRWWEDPEVRRLAEYIRATNDHSALPILGDALEEAGCDDQDYLDHTRERGGQVCGRGSDCCIVVDQLLNEKESFFLDHARMHPLRRGT